MSRTRTPSVYNIFIHDIAKSIKAGDEFAYHLRYVIKAAKSMCNTSGDYSIFMDLISSGSIGLMKALKKYKPELGYTFLTYARAWIYRYMQIAYNVHNHTVKLNDYQIMHEKCKNKVHVVQMIEEYEESIKNDEDVERTVLDKTMTEEIWNIAMKKLRSKEVEILKLRYVEGLSFQEIGSKYDLSKQRIEQIEKSCLEKIKTDLFTTRELEPYYI